MNWSNIKLVLAPLVICSYAQFSAGYTHTFFSNQDYNTKFSAAYHACANHQWEMQPRKLFPRSKGACCLQHVDALIYDPACWKSVEQLTGDALKAAQDKYESDMAAYKAEKARREARGINEKSRGFDVVTDYELSVQAVNQEVSYGWRKRPDGTWEKVRLTDTGAPLVVQPLAPPQVKPVFPPATWPTTNPYQPITPTIPTIPGVITPTDGPLVMPVPQITRNYCRAARYKPSAGFCGSSNFRIVKSTGGTDTSYPAYAVIRE